MFESRAPGPQSKFKFITDVSATVQIVPTLKLDRESGSRTEAAVSCICTAPCLGCHIVRETTILSTVKIDL